MTTDQQQETLETLGELSDKQRQDIANYIQSVSGSTDWKSKVDKNNLDLKKGLKVHVPFERTSQAKDGKIFVNKADPKRPIAFTGDEHFVEGPVGQALEYDGINDTVIKDGHSSFNSNEAFSHALWVKFPEPFRHARIFATDDGSFNKVPGVYCFIEDEKLIFQLCSTWDYNYIKVISENPFPFDQWTHLTVTYDGSAKAKGLKIYLDNQTC